MLKVKESEKSSRFIVLDLPVGRDGNVCLCLSVCEATKCKLLQKYWSFI